MKPETDTAKTKPKFFVKAYSLENFIQIVNKFNSFDHGTTVDYQDNPHFSYFEEYFKALDAQTIVVERYYIDRDYLQDYAGYYVRCFKRYRRRCVRLHFFSTAFNIEDFKQVYFDKGRLDHALLQKAYIGFVVIKPLPKTIFGRTCLKTYDGDQGRRHYITRNYDVNLYGLELKVDSLAYQEQDRIVSACATSALWSIFQYTGVQFQHPILSPLEITNAACINFPSEQRFIPNSGLEINQMIHGIYSVGLEPYIIPFEGMADVKNEIYALLKGGIPMILGMALINTSKANEKSDSDVITDFDNHAVAVSGYSLGGSYAPFDWSEILLESSRLDKLYCHDDQIGPFSRIIFHGEKIKALLHELSIEPREYETLLSSCPGDDYEWGEDKAISVPVTILAPIYHKIRIPYHVILWEIIKLDFSLEDLRDNDKLPLEERMSWDIYLTRNSTFKSNLIENKELPQYLKELFLFQNMPRYIWRATALHKGEKIMDVIFDATDLEQGKKLHCLLVYSQQMYEAICTHFDEKRNSLKNKDLWSPIFDWFYDKYGKDMKIQ
jgi:hypothetical protein